MRCGTECWLPCGRYAVSADKHGRHANDAHKEQEQGPYLTPLPSLPFRFSGWLWMVTIALMLRSASRGVFSAWLQSPRYSSPGTIWLGYLPHVQHGTDHSFKTACMASRTIYLEHHG